MDVVAPVRLNHLSAIDFAKDGGLFLAASNLTRQYWMGQLWYFARPECAPDGQQANAVTQSEVGINDIACLSSDTPRVVCGFDSGAVQLVELQDDNLVCTVHAQEHDNFITSVHVSADQKNAVSASQDNRIKIWDLQEFKSIHTFRGHSDTVYCAVPHPDHSEIFISCSQDGKLLLWDTRLPKPASVIESFSNASAPTCVAWQPAAGYSFVVGKECGALIYRDCRLEQGDPQSLTPQQRPVHSRPVTRLACAPHRPHWVASASEDSTAAVCHVTSDGITVIHSDERHKDFVQGVAWHPVSNELYTCSWDSQVLRASIKDEGVESVKEKVRQMDVVENETQISQPEGEVND